MNDLIYTGRYDGVHMTRKSRESLTEACILSRVPIVGPGDLVPDGDGMLEGMAIHDWGLAMLGA